MKRVIAWLCSLLSAIGITACDYINVKELQPGVSTATEVRERFGPPHMEWKNDDGSVTWEFSRQPQGVECGGGIHQGAIHVEQEYPCGDQGSGGDLHYVLSFR